MTRAQDWLPAEASERGAVRAAVETVIAGWASHWFGRGDLRLFEWALAERGRPVDPAAWRPCGPGLEVCCPVRAANRLAGLALDARLEGMDLGERDRLLVSAFARRIVDDLVERLRRLFVGDTETVQTVARPDDRRITASIADGSDVLISLSVSTALLLGLTRRTLPAPPVAARIAGDRLSALGHSAVRLEVTLGTATLSLAEAKGLACGDVLVLDRRLADPAELSLASSADVVARGVLTEDDGRLALVLQTAS